MSLRVSGRPTGLPGLLLVVLGAALSLAAPGPAVAADYEAVAPPYTQRDKVGDASVRAKQLARTDLTRRQAKAADITRVGYAIVEHDGEPSAQVTVTLRQVLPRRLESLVQSVQVYFDEETLLDGVVHISSTSYRSSYGGPGSDAAGCDLVDADTDGRTFTQWVPLRCLPTDTSEMSVTSYVRAAAADRTAKRRIVGLDATRDPAFIRWR